MIIYQEIPPYETKGVMRASFSSREADNHTAFIRIKTNASDNTEVIILPVEVEVTTGLWKSDWNVVVFWVCFVFRLGFFSYSNQLTLSIVRKL